MQASTRLCSAHAMPALLRCLRRCPRPGCRTCGRSCGGACPASGAASRVRWAGGPCRAPCYASPAAWAHTHTHTHSYTHTTPRRCPAGDNAGLWGAQWRAYGACALPLFTNLTAYFRYTLELSERLDVNVSGPAPVLSRACAAAFTRPPAVCCQLGPQRGRPADAPVCSHSCSRECTLQHLP